MYPVSQKFLTAIRKSHNVTFRAEVQANGRKILDLYPDSGSVNVVADANVRRTMQMTLADTFSTISETLPVYNTYTQVNSLVSTYSGYAGAYANYSLLIQILSYTVSTQSKSLYVPTNAYSALTPYGNEIKIWRGIQYSDGTKEEIPLGVFLITTVEVDASDSGTTIKIEGVDRSLRVSRNKPTDSVYYSAGGSPGPTGLEVLELNKALSDLIKDRWADVKLNFSATESSNLLINAFTIGIGEDPWAKAMEIAMSCGYDLYFDADGVCCLNTIPDSSTSLPQVSYLEGNDAVLMSVNRKITSDDTYNGVHMTATGTAMLEPFMATAWDNDSSSPTYRYGGFGQVPVFLTSNLLSTQAIAKASAVRNLYRYIGSAEEISWTSITNPAHDVWDVVQIVNKATQLNVTLIIDSLVIPFGAGETMSAKARSIRFLPVS